MFTQPTRTLTVKLNNIQLNNFDLLDEWLQSVLKIDIEEKKHSSKNIKLLINRSLLLINSLFQATKLPCFSKGSILKIQKDSKTPTNWIIKIAVVNIEHIPDICYKLIINFTMKNITWMMQNSITTKNIKYLYESIQVEVLNKLKMFSHSGKSTLPILHCAYQHEIPFFHLGGGVYQLGWGSKARRIDRSIIDVDSAIGAKLSENKMLASNLIRTAGLPAPVNALALNIKDAIMIANSIGWPIVVKPVDGNRGEGVSIGIINNKQLEVAFKMAKEFSKSKQILIEKEVKGVAHRILVVNKKFIYAIKRLPKSIEGDGHNNISTLIHNANKLLLNTPPWLRTEMFPSDNEAIEAMKSLNYSLTSVPKDGEFIPLRMIQSTASGGTPKDLTNDIHPDNIDISLSAAKLFGLNIAGIDIITTDIKKPWHENGAIINEVNFAPVLGGSEISKKYIPDFIKEIFQEDSRIQVDVILGGVRAMDTALKEQRKFLKNTKNCFITSDNITINHLNNKVIFPFQSLYKRCKALLLNTEVDAIILVIQTDEFLYSGLPVDKINKITLVDKNIMSIKNINKKVDAKNIDLLFNLLQLP